LRSCQYQPVQWCEALQWNLPAKRERGFLFCPISKLHCCEVLGNGSKSTLYIVPIQLELLAVGIETSERDMDVRMFGVEVRYRDPFERRAQIGLHTAHHVPRQELQVKTLAEFRGNDQFPQPWITALLPVKKFRSNIDTSRPCRESCFVRQA
jgi:hypothetical protein